VISKISKYRRKNSLSRRKVRGRSRGRSISRMDWRPILLFGGIGLGIVALVLVVIFVIVPLFGDGGKEEETATPSAVATPVPTPIAKTDMSDVAEELIIDYKSINDPYMSGTEMIFSTGNKLDSAPELDRLAIYDMTAKTVTEVAGITKKYTNIFEPKMNADYIVYLDCKSEYGGAVCGMNRATGETFVMREYLYGKPYVSLSGQYAVWMQQVGRGTDSSGNATAGKDRLYVYDLSTQECVELETFSNNYLSYSWAYIGDNAIVYVQPEGEDETLSQSSSSLPGVEVVVVPLTEGGDQQAVRFIPGTFVYDPLIEGDYIVYLDGTGAVGTQLMMCKKSGDTYTAPVAIATDVLNYDVGEGYVVYTLNKVVYIYYFADGSSGALSSDMTSAILGSANGKDVVWYDVSDGLDSPSNVIMHITVP
jgi:hypothetical protein